MAIRSKYRCVGFFILTVLFGGVFSHAAVEPTINSKIYFADVNGDNLLDLMLGDLNRLKVHINHGTLQLPIYDTDYYSVPLYYGFERVCGVFFDIDYDGDMDLFYGTQLGTIGWRRNIGTAQAPNWSELVKSGSFQDSFNNIDLEYRIQMLNFVDFDGDGDQDMVFNDVNGSMYYYLNKDKENDGWVDGQGVTWTRLTSGVPTTSSGGESTKHHWCDEDGDGDFDILSGLLWGGVRIYANLGSPTNYSSFTTTMWAHSGDVSGNAASPFLEDFNGDGFNDLYYTYNEGMAGFISFINAITRSSPNDLDDIPPAMASNALTIYGLQSNAITLKWPYIYDSPNSSYRSGVKSYTLYRSTEGPGFVPSAQNQLWKHYQLPHFPDDVHEFPDGDKFKIEGGNFYYKDAALAGGNTYYYKLVVADYKGNTATTDAASQELAPPELTSVNVQLTPSTSSNAMLLTITTVDQYGMDYPIGLPPAGGPNNVTITVLENGQPVDYALYDLDAQAPLPSTTFSGVASRSFNITYRQDQSCISFSLRVQAANWVSGQIYETVSGDSATAQIDRGNPPLPGNLRALTSEITMTSITVRWDAAVDTCTSVAYYKVYGKLASAPSYSVLSMPTGLSYIHSNLAVGTTYQYYVTAVDAVGLETAVADPSAVSIRATTLLDATPPTVPTGVTAVYINGNTQVQVDWGLSTDADSGVHYYEIQKKLGDGAFFETITTLNHPTAQYIDNQVYPGNAIYYRVRAVDNVANASDWSVIATANVSTDTTPPSVPSNLQGTALSTTSIYLAWNPSTDNTGGSGMRSYKVYRNSLPNAIAEVTTNTYTNTGLVPNTEYSYQVSAVDNAGNESAKCTAISVRTQQDPSLIEPNPPQSLHSTARTPTTIALAWSAPVDNGAVIAQYVVYRHSSATSPVDSGVAVVVVTTLSTVLTNLQPSTTYYYTVTAVSNRSVESDHSNRLATSTTDVAPTDPTNVRASAVGGSWVDLAWNASIPPAGSTLDFYGVYFAVSSPFGGYSYTRIANTDGTSYHVTGLTSEQTYKFSIRAYDSLGRPSHYTDPISITTQVADDVAPPVPANLNASPLDAHSVQLTWDAVTDTGGSGLAGYELYRGGTLLATTVQAYYLDSNLQPLTTYSYTVLSKDNAGNKSAQSTPVQATTFGLTQDLLCAHVANTEAWMTRISVVNIGAEDNAVVFFAYNADGNLVETVTLPSLAPSACFEADVADIFSPDTFTQDIWVKVASASDLKGVLIFGTRDDQTLVTIPMFSRGAADLIFPYVYTSDIYYTGLTLINTGADTAMPTLLAFSETGEYLTSTTLAIPPNGKYVRLIESIFSYADPGRIRFIKVDSSKALIGFELFGSFQFEGLAGLPAFSPTVDLFKTTAKSADGGEEPKDVALARPTTPTGFTGSAISASEIYLSWNPNPESDIDHYSIYNNDGPVPNLIANVTGTNYTVTGLQPQSTHWYSLKAVNTGSEESEATAQVRVTTLPSGQQDYPFRVFYNEIPDTGFYSIGVTFSNLGTAATTVHLELYDVQGNKLAEAESPVAVLEQKTRMIENFFNNQLPAGSAYLKVGALDKLMGFELYYTTHPDQAPYQFDGVIGVESGVTKLYFPLVRTGADWQSTLRMTNLAAVANSVTVHAYDINGASKGDYATNLVAKGKLDMGLSAMFPSTVNEIAWIYVESADQVIGDLFYVSVDQTKLSSYMGLGVSGD